jgi:hemoglobin-like flavoprotein
MNTETIAETWYALGKRQTEFVEAFYGRFFERFPAYRKFFPQTLSHAHLDKMVQTLALMAKLSEDKTVIAPHMHRLGAEHMAYDLQPHDFDNFKTVFLEVLGEYLEMRWVPAVSQAWSEAFDQVLVPMMLEGMKKKK